MVLQQAFGKKVRLVAVSCFCIALLARIGTMPSTEVSAHADTKKAEKILSDISSLVSDINKRHAAEEAAAAEASGPLLGAGGGQTDDEPVITPHAPVPPPHVKGLIVLFSGKSEEIAANWRKNGSDQPAAWELKDDGAMESHGGDIVSKQDFRDFQLHVEFKVPFRPGKHGQERGNSGVGLQAHYEIQVLDSYGFKEPGSGDCGAVYSQHAPLVNACRPPMNWQTYDITFRAPRFGADGMRTAKARVTVIQNGVVVQDNQEIEGPTGIQGDRPIDKPGPIYLQDHGNPVWFRNVWVLPLPEEGATHYEPK